MTSEKRRQHAICTLFDHRFMSRGLCMINSVRRYGPEHEIWALCLSDEAYRGLRALNLPNVQPISIPELEEATEGLRAAKENRLPIEFYYTCMAALHRYVYDHAPHVTATMYVDADIKFFQDPETVFAQFEDAPAAITPHNFPAHLQQMERFGKFNAGWSAFTRSDDGQRLLNWWLERSLEWCYGYVDIENDRFANQRYLNRFEKIAPGTKVLGKGCNLGPWNVGNYELSERDGNIFVDDEPLYFFHFHGIKKGFGVFYFDMHRTYRTPHTRLMRNQLYRPYVRELREMDAVVRGVVNERTDNVVKLRGYVFMGIDIKNFLRSVRSALVNILDVFAGRPIVAYGSRVW